MIKGNMHGSQIRNKSIKKGKLDLVNPVSSFDPSTKIYVDELISKERQSNVNVNMYANDTSPSTSGVALACNIPILEDPVPNSKVDVYINGVNFENGFNQYCYFSPNGVIIRDSNDVRIGDKLYWNKTVTDIELDSDDVIHYSYLTNDKNSKYIVLQANTTTPVSIDDDIILLEFEGLEGYTTTLDFGGVLVDVTITSGNLVFDDGGLNEYTFTYIGEEVTVTINSNIYVIRFEGISSFIFSILKINNTIDYSIYSDPTKIISYNGASSSNSFIYFRVSPSGKWLIFCGGFSNRQYIYKNVNEKWVFHKQLGTHINRVFSDISDKYYVSSRRSGDGETRLYRYDFEKDRWSDSYEVVYTNTGSPLVTTVIPTLKGDKLILSDSDTGQGAGNIKVYNITENAVVEEATLDKTGLPAGARLGLNGIGYYNDIIVTITNLNDIVYWVYDGVSWSAPNIYTLDSGKVDFILAFDNDIVIAGDPNYASNDTGIAILYWFDRTNFPSVSMYKYELPYPTAVPNDYYEQGYGLAAEVIDENNIVVLARTTVRNKLSTTYNNLVSLSGSGTNGWSIDGEAYAQVLHTAFAVDNVHIKNRSVYSSIVDNDEYSLAYTRFVGDVYTTTSPKFTPSYTKNLSIVLSDDVGVTSGYGTATLEYDYVHPYNISQYDEDAEFQQVVKWYSKKYVIDSFVEIPELRNKITVPITNDNLGYLYKAEVAPIDKFGNIGAYSSTEKTLIKEHGFVFDGYDKVINQKPSVFTLTILSGTLGGLGVGVHTLHAMEVSQNSNSSTISYYAPNGLQGISYIYAYGTTGGNYYFSISFYTTVGYNFFSFSGTDTDTVDFISNEAFQTFVLPNVTFTIQKNSGFRQKP